MRISRVLAVAVCSLAVAGVAQAQVPASVNFNARLTDSSGVPVSGNHQVQLALFSVATGGSSSWSETTTPTFSTTGTVSVEMGAVTPLSATILDGSKKYLEITIDGTTLTPRVAIVSVPYAIRAGTADALGSLQASDVQHRITGTCSAGQAFTGVNADGTVTCASAGVGTITGVTAGSGLSGGGSSGNVTVGLASCASGEVLASDGTNWNCTAIGGGLGESPTNPATSCAALHTARATLPSGAYWLKPSTAPSAFRAYCDMTTSGGGWTLVWSNLRGGRGKVATEIQWKRAITTLPLTNGDVSSDLESFAVYTGLEHYTPMAPGGLMRYDWAPDYGTAIQQRQICPFVFSNLATYQITFNSPLCTQPVGSVAAGLFASHNNAAFTAYDRDNDSWPSGNCANSYSGTPFWYTNCWSGNINGGGEGSNGYANGAYWTGSANQWGAANGVGGGNGWLYVK